MRDLSILNRPAPEARLLVSLWELAAACQAVLDEHAGPMDDVCTCPFCRHAAHLPYAVQLAQGMLESDPGQLDLVALKAAWRALRGADACQHGDEFACVATPFPAGRDDDDDGSEDEPEGDEPSPDAVVLADAAA